MPIPANYFYKDGAYWGYDDTGPWGWNGTSMVLLGGGGARTILGSNVDLTSNLLAETNLFLLTIPAGTIQANGILWMAFNAERTAGADTYTLRGRLGANGGTPSTDNLVYTPPALGAGAVGSLSTLLGFYRVSATTMRRLAPGTNSFVSAVTGATTGAARAAAVTVANLDTTSNFLALTCAWTAGGIDTLSIGGLQVWVQNP